MTMLMRRCLGRAQLVADLVEPWRRHDQETMKAQDAEELLVECLGLVELNQQTWTACLDVLFSPNARGLDELGESIRAAVQRTLTIMELLAPYLKQAEDHGHHFARRADFDEAVAQTKQLAQEIEVKWPFYDEKMVEESRAALARGEFQSVEELLHAAQNGTFPPN